MHRSGTSMLARMLNLCGLDLGREEDLYPAEPDNPEGFWEHIRIVTINDAILERFNGAWDSPPVLPANWETSPSLEDLRQQAKEVMAEFKGGGPWGWKDP